MPNSRAKQMRVTVTPSPKPCTGSTPTPEHVQTTMAVNIRRSSNQRRLRRRYKHPELTSIHSSSYILAGVIPPARNNPGRARETYHPR
ncbi:hypothetical protein HYC85_011262 [Camellia sinensis]|uniref:Uncharacterized protein n=1 Tax=Camellia sinensis TaxID=4442 RepID=A0A7J7H8U6_CAMSI|nr:hypothetical protein HYC85_011262 [Camellia sinensis]